MEPVGFFDEELGLVALVTGAGSGIGAATAKRLVLEGVRRLVLTDRDGAGLAKSAAETGLGEEDILTATFNVADENAWAGLTGIVRERFGRLDLAVANAGLAAEGPIANFSFAEWRRVMSTNLDGVFLTLKHCMNLIEAGRRGGAIVVVSSIAARKTEIGMAAYAASKAAIEQLARVAAKEGAADAIRVNAIAPGGVETPIWRDAPFFQEQVAALGSEAAAFSALGAKSIPLGRYATAREIAGQIAFLLSETAANITGATLVSDGGYGL